MASSGRLVKPSNTGPKGPCFSFVGGEILNRASPLPLSKVSSILPLRAVASGVPSARRFVELGPVWKGSPSPALLSIRSAHPSGRMPARFAASTARKAAEWHGVRFLLAVPRKGNRGFLFLVRDGLDFDVRQCRATVEHQCSDIVAALQWGGLPAANGPVGNGRFCRRI